VTDGRKLRRARKHALRRARELGLSWHDRIGIESGKNLAFFDRINERLNAGRRRAPRSK